MKLPAIVRKITVLFLLVASQTASATVVTLVAPSASERQVQNNRANAADSQPGCTSDGGCQLLAGATAVPAPSQLAAPANEAAAGNDISYFTSTFAAVRTDSVLSSPGSQPGPSYSVPTHAIEAADQYASDEELKWKVKLKMLQAYSSVRALVSQFDTDQGSAREAASIASAPYQQISAPNNGAGYGSGAVDRDFNSLCVAKDGSYNTVGASNQRSCPEGSVYVSTNRSAAMAEYVTYSQSLNSSPKNMASPYAMHSADSRAPRSDPAPQQYRRCSDCDFDLDPGAEPGMISRFIKWLKEPSSVMLLLGIAVVIAVISDALTKARNN
ncbi:hypothetical protein GCM10027277_35120 [Pseudoduganella ginsengisoli]|uniref:Uncharacterized protein n=1 Tax=Pseudoduganella ginsengisoli TaxID=1462440 RepID=A0A6L6PY14_9BURK|nr:hypothetical protein [Pseudoduganella ginsengisoli]MTW02136.1 hypothetical protein [Pseudoduganella ginsengisoli]